MNNKILAFALSAVLLVSSFVGCTKGADEYKSENMENGVTLEKGDTVAVMDVKGIGSIKIKLYPEVAPKAVENFTTHAKKGYYDSTTFHRIIKDFMIQGGDPDGTGAGGESIWGEDFEDEFKEEYYHFNGALSMANIGVPNTNSSQFFIVNAPPIEKEMFGEDSGYSEAAVTAYTTRGGTPFLDFKHTVFGMVYSGMDIVDKIANTKASEEGEPATEVIVERIKIYTVK